MPLDTKVEPVSVDTSTSTPVVEKPSASIKIDDQGMDRVDRALAAAKGELGVDDTIADKDLSLDNLPEFDVDPEVKAPSFQDLLKEADAPTKALLKHFQADYTRKTQRLSQTQRDYEEQLAALVDSEFSKGVTDKATEDLGEFDPYDTGSFEKRIEQEVAKRMAEMLNPLQAQVAKQKQEAALSNFRVQHPDLEDLKMDVAKELAKNETLTLEQAYWVVKGQKLAESNATQEAELSNYKKVAREAGLKVGGNTRGKGHGVPDHIVKQGGMAIAGWLEQNQK